MLATPFLSIWGDDASAGDLRLPLSPETRGPVILPSEAARRTGSLASMVGDRNDLAAQRWAVVAPATARGQHLAELVRPLCDLRAGQQHAEVIRYFPREHATAADAEAFLERDYRREPRRRAEAAGEPGGEWAALPRYLLLLGDADGISWAFQQTLARHGLFVGRLCFPDDAGYAAYADKALRAEDAVVPERTALLYAVSDGTSATKSGRERLLVPLAAQLAAALRLGRLRGGPLSIHEVGLGPPGPDDELRAMLSRAGAAPGGAMFSVSHGVGLGRGASAEARRARQGGLQITSSRALFGDGIAERRGSRAGDPVFVADEAFAGGVAQRPFLDLGAWFFFACFSAGTPSESAYAPWLRSAGDPGRAERALATLPGPGEPPFVAALPQAALANPRGPIAVLGHVDLAWTWSYEAERAAPSGTTMVPRVERLSEVYKALLQGDRAGVAHHALASFGMSVGASLRSLDEAQASSTANPVFEKASLWLEYQDLDGYVLLGDPAARLPGTAARPAKAAPPEVTATPTRGSAEPEGPPERVLRVEKAVLECLSRAGDAARLAEMARRVNVSPQELAALVDAYREAGRRALADRISGT